MLIWIIMFYIGNLLDILTTYFGMRDLPKEKMAKKELNPIMSLFIHNRRATYAFKFGLATLIVVLVTLNPSYLIMLSIMTIALFLVAGGNLLTTYLTRKGKLSFGKFLTTKLKLPKAVAYLISLALCIFASVVIYGSLWI